MDSFLGVFDLLQLNHGDGNHLNITTISKGIEVVIVSQRKTQDQMDSQWTSIDL
jgi:hypothetical protein